MALVVGMGQGRCSEFALAVAGRTTGPQGVGHRKAWHGPVALLDALMTRGCADRTRVPVSVVIPCYCCASTIDRAVESIARQTLLPAEVILIDDGSPDDGETLGALHAVAARYAGIMDMRVIELPENKGPAGARNAGWDAATQPYIAFLDADDSWLPYKLEIQYGWMQNHTEVDICGHLFCKKEQMGCGAHEQPVESVRIRKIEILFHNVFPTSSVMLKKLIKLRFDERKRYIEDYDLWLRAFFHGFNLARINVELACNYKNVYGDFGLSAKLLQMERGELDCYMKLWREHHIGMMATTLCLIWSLIKFGRRIGTTYFMKVIR